MGRDAGMRRDVEMRVPMLGCAGAAWRRGCAGALADPLKSRGCAGVAVRGNPGSECGLEGAGVDS